MQQSIPVRCFFLTPEGSRNPRTDSPIVYRNIAVPPSNPYALDAGYTGPFESLNLYPDGGFAVICNESQPYVALTITINGVDYRLDSHGNMLHVPSLLSAPNYCNVALMNTTGGKPDVVLGAPFLRSVYM